ETMDDHDGAGLAAPQVQVSRRIVIYGVAANPRYPDADTVPLTVLVNPKIAPLTQEQEEDWEGCLSVPDLRGKVPRCTRVRVEATCGVLSTSSRPPRIVTSRSAMWRPRPTPPKRRVAEPSTWRNISKITERCSAAMPIPVSRTAIVSVPPAADAVTSTRPAGVNRSEEHTSELQSRGHLVCR